MQNWINSILNELDPHLLDGMDVECSYPRDIIDVDWTITGAKESTNIFQHDMLTLVAEDSDGHVYDIMITEPFYPRGVKSLDQLVNAHVAGVNPMVEINDSDHCALVCKYARLIVDGSRKINPHVGIKHQKHTRLCDSGEGHAGDIKANSKRSHFETSTHVTNSAERVNTKKHTRMRRGDEIKPHEDVILRWI